MRFIYQHPDWPHFRWNASKVEMALTEASFALGRLTGKLGAIGFSVQNEAVFETLSAEILNSAKIEGEELNRDDVRSSVARRMEVVLAASKGTVSHTSEARSEMIFDATRNWNQAMTRDRLFAWHAALFPTGYSGLVKVATAQLRDDRDGPIRVVSRHGMMERVHFVAPDAKVLHEELAAFLTFLNASTPPIPYLIKTAIAHLWFLTLHPFDDGNGRVARALSEYLLAKGEASEMRFYSLSAQIQEEKEAYYNALEHAQCGTLDVTRWVKWFLECHHRAVEAADLRLAGILKKATFWQQHAAVELNANQRLMLNKLLDGFNGNLTSSKWATICKVSQDTASREINALIAKKLLQQTGQGRATHYVLTDRN